MTNLTRDLLLDAVRERRKTRRQATLAFTALTALALTCALLSKQPQEPSPPLASVSEEKASSPELLYTPINSEEELLALLADQSPILATLPDGTRELILTNPH